MQDDSVWKEVLDRSLALLTNVGARFRPEPYVRRRWGFELRLVFPCVRFSDFRGREAELERARNPFALLVLAHLRREATRGNPGRQLSAKQLLVRMLYERGYRRDDIVYLFRFIDWLLWLPAKLEGEFEEWLQEYEKGKHMPYVTSIERIGIKKGRREARAVGRAEGLLEAIESILKARFGKDGVDLVSRSKLPQDARDLRRILPAILQSRSVAGAARVLAKATTGQKQEGKAPAARDEH